MTSWQKAIKYAAMAFAILLVVSIVGGIIATAASLSALFDGSETPTGEMHAYTVEGSVTELDIEIGVADFVILTGEAFGVESNHEAITVEERGGCLLIRERTSRWSWNTDRGICVTLTVPAGHVFAKADITTGAGRVCVDALSATKLRLVLGAGEVTITSLYAEERADIDGGAGRITVNGGALHNLDLDMGVGELVLTSKLSGECDLDLGIGKTQIQISDVVDNYRIDLEKGLGEAKLDGVSVSGGAYGSGVNHLDVSGGIGTIEIRFADVAVQG